MRLCVVTGTAGGLGAEIADYLAARGEMVISLRRHPVAPDATGGRRPVFRTLAGDLSRPHDVSVLAREIAAAVSGETTSVVFFNNAGVVGPIDLVGCLGDVQPIADHITVNYTSPVVLINALVAALPGGANLDIVNITSGAADRPIPGWSLYCSSKRAIKAFLDVLDAENERVSVRHVDPGVMDTAMQATIRGASADAFPDVQTFRAYRDGGLLRRPAEVARMIVEGCLDR